jgi:hypothetical protein
MHRPDLCLAAGLPSLLPRGRSKSIVVIGATTFVLRFPATATTSAASKIPASADWNAIGTASSPLLPALGVLNSAVPQTTFE